MVGLIGAKREKWRIIYFDSLGRAADLTPQVHHDPPISLCKSLDEATDLIPPSSTSLDADELPHRISRGYSGPDDAHLLADLAVDLFQPHPQALGADDAARVLFLCDVQ